jgi:hypothetical protein
VSSNRPGTIVKRNRSSKKLETENYFWPLTGKPPLKIINYDKFSVAKAEKTTQKGRSFFIVLLTLILKNHLEPYKMPAALTTIWLEWHFKMSK